MGGIFDMVGGLIGLETSAERQQKRAMQAQADAQQKQLQIQRRQQETSMAQQRQQQNKASAATANAAAAVSKVPTSTNESNLTGGLGVTADQLELGAPTLLAGMYETEEQKKRKGAVI